MSGVRGEYRGGDDENGSATSALAWKGRQKLRVFPGDVGVTGGGGGAPAAALARALFSMTTALELQRSRPTPVFARGFRAKSGLGTTRRPRRSDTSRRVMELSSHIF